MYLGPKAKLTFWDFGYFFDLFLNIFFGYRVTPGHQLHPLQIDFGPTPILLIKHNKHRISLSKLFFN